MVNSENKMWFAPKKFGYGAGLPISWEGWALLAGFIATVAALGFLTQLYVTGSGGALVHVVAVGMLLIPFVLIVKKRTDGGWRWRNGNE